MLLACISSAQVTPHTELFRVPIPDTLPDHPRVFCTAADLARIRADYQAGDAYTRLAVDAIVAEADNRLAGEFDLRGRTPDAADFRAAAALAQAYAVSGNDAYGERALEMLRAFADICPTLETTRAAGRFTSSTLIEGPLAVNMAMAYDLIASAAFVTAADREHIKTNLLRIIGWECGHKCGHRNSSNWRTWALCILAACGFASGDRELIEEAINGAWDPERNSYLYGIVQQLTHSIFSDGIHWERCIGYTYYTGTAMMYVMAAAKNSGIDLWHAELPGILGPFEGGADHEEFGPPGNRSIRAFLDAPFYYAFQNGRVAQYGDSGTRSFGYHPIYEMAYAEYGDPKYGWLISQRRGAVGDAPGGWGVWKPAGEPEGRLVAGAGPGGGAAYRLTTRAGERIALTQRIHVPADQTVHVSGWVATSNMAGGSAHIRCNWGDTAVFTNRVRVDGPWQQVAAELPPDEGAEAGTRRGVMLHVFLEEGAGEALWADITATVGDSGTNVVVNPSFAQSSADGRGLDFWSLVHSPADVAESHFSLAEDATIGLTGQHVNGCTLFPVGGFAILRSDPLDVDATAVNIGFGPYGSGHDHPDRLHFDLYGLGEIVCPDAGSWGYDNPMHLTWANQTIAHNTLTVDETSQYPQQLSDSIWASERDGRRVFGVLRLFHPGELLKAVRVTCDTAYEGVTMDRTLCIVGTYMLDVFRAGSALTHTYDLALHGLGAVTCEPPVPAVDGNPFTARGYEHLGEIRTGAAGADILKVTFDSGGRRVQVLQVCAPDEVVILATGPKRDRDTSAFIARRVGDATTYVRVIEPYSDRPVCTGISASETVDGTVVVIETTTGVDTFTIATDLEGAIRLSRGDGVEETAYAWTVLPD